MTVDEVALAIGSQFLPLSAADTAAQVTASVAKECSVEIEVYRTKKARLLTPSWGISSVDEDHLYSINENFERFLLTKCYEAWKHIFNGNQESRQFFAKTVNADEGRGTSLHDHIMLWIDEIVMEE